MRINPKEAGMIRRPPKMFACLAVLFAFATLTAAVAEPTKIEGVIIARSGNEMIVQYLQGAEIAFLLDDSTRVSQVGGVFKARRTDKSMAALIPGLKVKAEGERNPSGQLVATSVKFGGDDLEQAQIAAAANRQQHEAHQEEMERQAAALREQNEQIKLQEAQLAEHKAQIDAAVARFGQLDDYYILDEVTVFFDNGKTTVDSKFESPLLELATKAQSVNGYVIEVKGYASTSGSKELNQQLSEDRADNVTNVLLQKGHVPLTRILAPGAMGEAHQVGNDNSAEGQAQNRRVVVRVLQNKAVAGV
jgi:OOP family OmpA-OmpF porin